MGDKSESWAVAAASALLLALLLVGGSTQEATGTGDLVVRLLSLPILAWGAYRLLHAPLGTLRATWLAFAGTLLLIPLLQLAPLAGGGEGRAALADDLARFGLPPPRTWSLLPSATRDAAFSLLPPLAVFALASTLSHAGLRRLAAAIVALAMASLLLGIAQLGAPQESLLNPYPQWRPALGGFFANPNHQAALLVVAATFAGAHLAGLADAAEDRVRPQRMLRILAAGTALALALVALPLTGSRAGVVLAIVAVPAAALARRPSATGRGRAGLAVGLGAMVFGALAALRWMRTDAVDDLRGPLRAASETIAARFAPTGSGIGSYVPVFEQEAPPQLLMGSYVNHAHNEYLQWWMEGGVPALLAMALGAVVLDATLVRLLRLPGRDRALGLAAWIALAAMLAHSLVDYPLRTPALLAIAAALAGIACAEATRARKPASTHVRHGSGRVPGRHDSTAAPSR
ncbi:hypothetical protein WQ56_07990 [Luteimonas sp. FCS-9]|nr:hypothetical protein WQ56_07990 [Luteimonas sp. FCS-9]